MRLLELRKRIKSKKPNFVRQCAFIKRLKEGWRKPRGIHSKMRLKLKGHPRSVSVGWKSPKSVRSLHKSGLKEVLIHNIRELERLSPEENGIVIASNIGLKKKLEIVKKAKELRLTALNIDEERLIKKIEEIKKIKEKKSKDKKAEEKKPESEEPKKEDVNKKEKDRLEKEKVLTKRI